MVARHWRIAMAGKAHGGVAPQVKPHRTTVACKDATVLAVEPGALPPFVTEVASDPRTKPGVQGLAVALLEHEARMQRLGEESPARVTLAGGVA